MKNKIVLSLVIVIAGLVLAAATLAIFRDKSQRFLRNREEQSTSPLVSQTPTPAAAEKINFTNEGTYVLIDGRPVFLYKEPGNPSGSLDLRFAVDTRCDFGQGEGPCNTHQLQSGDQVFVEGRKDKNELTIITMKKI